MQPDTESPTVEQPTITDADSDIQNHLAHRINADKARTADIQSGTEKSDSKSLTNVRFSDLQISPIILRGLADAGFAHPSPVQIRAIPLGRIGLDLIVQAKSGTGKTVVFVVVVLEAIDVQRPVLQAVVLAPTREIALQSQHVFQRLGSHLPGLRCELFVGGLPLADDLLHLQGCHIAVATPGRLRYLIETGYMPVDQVTHFVLDEADLLLAGGADCKTTGGSANNAFPADVNSIWWSLPRNKQMLALSATYTDYLVEEHLQRYMSEPALVRLAAHDPALLGVRQFFSFIEPPDRSPASVFASKVASVCKLLSSVEFQQCLIFSNFHSSAQDLCDALQARGWPVGYISSTLDQKERFRAYNRLRAFHCRVLVSTDLTSRGIDAENVNLVVSLEVPWEHEIYVHRVGRAGRFGSYGASILIVADSPEEQQLLRRLQAKCPTKIVQLPDVYVWRELGFTIDDHVCVHSAPPLHQYPKDPIPADLATPQCPIDLNALVTVVSCLKSKARDENSNYAPPEARQKLPRSKRQVSSIVNGVGEAERELIAKPRNQSAIVTQSIDTPSACQMKWSKLPENLSKYLDVQSRCDVFNPDPNPSIMTQSLESELLKQLDAYHEAGMPIIQQIPPAPRTPSPTPVERALPFRPSPKHNRRVSLEVSREDVMEELPVEADHQMEPYWTEKSTAAWHEYQKLRDYAQWYHAAWQSTVDEYNVALNRLAQARGTPLQE